jgi:hypothetical protein
VYENARLVGLSDMVGVVGGGAAATVSVTGTDCGLFDAPEDVTVTDPL